MDRLISGLAARDARGKNGEDLRQDGRADLRFGLTARDESEEIREDLRASGDLRAEV